MPHGAKPFHLPTVDGLSTALALDEVEGSLEKFSAAWTSSAVIGYNEMEWIDFIHSRAKTKTSEGGGGGRRNRWIIQRSLDDDDFTWVNRLRLAFVDAKLEWDFFWLKRVIFSLKESFDVSSSKTSFSLIWSIEVRFRRSNRRFPFAIFDWPSARPSWKENEISSLKKIRFEVLRFLFEWFRPGQRRSAGNVSANRFEHVAFGRDARFLFAGVLNQIV